jgi:hypothetical protein
MAKRPGRVLRRGRAGGRRAVAIVSAKRAIQSSRLRIWDRFCEEAITSSPWELSRDCNRLWARSRRLCGREGLRARSKRNSTRVLVLFTCCPPGPGLRTKAKSSSASGMRTPPGRSTASGRWREDMIGSILMTPDSYQRKRQEYARQVYGCYRRLWFHRPCPHGWLCPR